MGCYRRVPSGLRSGKAAEEVERSEACRYGQAVGVLLAGDPCLDIIWLEMLVWTGALRLVEKGGLWKAEVS